MRSGLPVELIGWHLCRGGAVLHEPISSRFVGFNTNLAHFAIECNSHARMRTKRRRRMKMESACPIRLPCVWRSTQRLERMERPLCRSGNSKRIDARNDGGRSLECRGRRAQSSRLAGRDRGGHQTKVCWKIDQRALEGSTLSRAPIVTLLVRPLGRRWRAAKILPVPRGRETFPHLPQLCLATRRHPASRDLDSFEHRVVHSHVVSLRADRVLSFRVENHQVCVAADRDRSFARIKSE